MRVMDFVEVFPFLHPLGLLIFGSILLVCTLVGLAWPSKTQGRALPIIFALTICLFVSKPIWLAYALLGDLFFGSSYWHVSDSILFKASLARYFTLAFIFLFVFFKFRAIGLRRLKN